MITGYLHPSYAESLSEFGEPRRLQRSGGWILKRPVQGFQAFDGMGIYPLFLCEDWHSLRADLEEDGNDLVSLAVVADPFGEYDLDGLRLRFPDLVIPFKQHFVVDTQVAGAIGSERHRSYARKATQSLAVEQVDRPFELRDEWLGLYRALSERHHITGVAAFSERSLREQLNVPGIVAFRATHMNENVGMTLWFRHGDRAYYHLGAYSDTGYKLHASYALFWYAIRHFREAGLAWLNLGGGAGLHPDGRDGLSQFKRGWSTGTRTAYFCGRIFNRELYRDLSEACGQFQSAYFPAYRTGEL
jgi:hypothetical protein